MILECPNFAEIYSKAVCKTLLNELHLAIKWNLDDSLISCQYFLQTKSKDDKWVNIFLFFHEKKKKNSYHFIQIVSNLN